jgi:hypothetical protein
VTLPKARVVRIVSGGQSGADRAGIDFAISHGLLYGGWCPAGGWAEDYPESPGLLAVYPRLREAPSSDLKVRTSLNVRDSHATLIIRANGTSSPGTDLTSEVADLLGRPCLFTAGDFEGFDEWISTLGYELTLNVAGPRESEQRGVYAMTHELLDRFLCQ